MSSYEQEIVKQVYESLNKNNDGKISFDDFKVGMWSQGCNRAEISLKQKFEKCVKDDVLNLEELLEQFK